MWVMVGDYQISFWFCSICSEGFWVSSSIKHDCSPRDLQLKCSKHDCSPKLLLAITILRMYHRYKPNSSWYYGTISGKVTYLNEVEDEIQLTDLACSHHSAKHFI
jgi:hypothetical protein